MSGGQIVRPASQLLLQCRHRLLGLGGDAALDDGSIDHPTLAGHDDEIAGANERRVRTERLVHAADTRRRALFGRCDDVSDGKSTKDSEVPQIEGTGRYEKLWPQPQVRLALGLVIANPL